jgi:hypothetical protein
LEHPRRKPSPEALEQCLDCVTAAEAEGLYEVIEELRGFSEQTDRLIDLVERRLLWVRNYAEPILALSQAESDKGEPVAPPAPKAAADVRAVVIEECAGIADKFDCNLLGYPNEEAKSYYESGVIDASVNIAQAIRALALNPQIATVPVPAPTFTQMGCICPPTSEKTCESPMCPRKGFRFTAANIGQAST